MASAREDVLREVRRNLPADSPLPSLSGEWTQYADPHAQFLEVLRSVGGVGALVYGVQSLREELAALRESLSVAQVYSAMPEILAGNVDVGAIDDPHGLAAVDLAILPGELAVAENGAVWVTSARVPHRVAYFLSQFVALVVPADCIVSNMHEAYQWLHAHADAAAPFVAPRWGTFMSGPSKTADIEQALVIGAHGARSLHVFLIA